jgi:hypothetical protein
MDADGDLDLVLMFEDIGAYLVNGGNATHPVWRPDASDPLGAASITFWPTGPVFAFDR